MGGNVHVRCLFLLPQVGDHEPGVADLLTGAVLHHHRPTRGVDNRPTVMVACRQQAGLPASREPALLKMIKRAVSSQRGHVHLLPSVLRRVETPVYERCAVHHTVDQRTSPQPVGAARQYPLAQLTQVKPPPPGCRPTEETSAAIVQVQTIDIHTDLHKLFSPPLDTPSNKQPYNGAGTSARLATDAISSPRSWMQMCRWRVISSPLWRTSTGHAL